MKIRRATRDFTAADLPKNRPAVFFDCWKIRYRLLFALGGLLLVFCLPLLACHFTRDVMCASAAAAEGMDEAARRAAVATIRMYFSLIDIPCWLVLSVGLSGALRILRQLVWGEGIFFWEDFLTGIRTNGKPAALLFGLGALWGVLCELTGNLSGASGGLGYLPYISGVVLLLPIALLLFCEIAVYQSGFPTLLRNAVILYFRTLPTTLAAAVPLLLPVLVTGILDAFPVPLFVRYVFLLVYVFLLLPSTVMGEFLYASFVFDRHINRRLHPEYVDKGIHREQGGKSEEQ